ncbi:MAG: DegV family protein [Anaerolineae bacterium]|jgi:DegV family protein with EDD domain|nr:DegV family protein [Anaerolineae bacterium]
MQIVTDQGADLSPQQLEGIKLHVVPLRINFEGKTYEDIDAAKFYEMLSNSENFPTTSQPSVGDFVTLYEKLAQEDPDILSIHISSGLSGTVNSARAAVPMVPSARITVVDTKTLSCPQGWQVECAARALQKGWSLERILPLLNRIGDQVNGIFTLSSLRYLIHGGRISHIKGLVASLLNIKPIIGVERASGKYVSFAQEITLKRAINRLVDVVVQRYGEGSRLRVQLLHGMNPEAVAMMKEGVEKAFECVFLPTVPVAPVLGAHTGASLVGMSVGHMDVFEGLV